MLCKILTPCTQCSWCWLQFRIQSLIHGAAFLNLFLKWGPLCQNFSADYLTHVPFRSKFMNFERILSTGSPPRYWTQICQLPSTLSPTRSLSRNAGLLVSYTNYLTPPQTTSAASLKLHTNLSSNHDTTPVSISVNPHIPSSPRRHLKISLQSPAFYCWGRPMWFGWNIHFCFVSSLYDLVMLICGPVDALVSLRYVLLCPPSIFVCFLPFKVFLIIHIQKKNWNIL